MKKQPDPSGPVFVFGLFDGGEQGTDFGSKMLGEVDGTVEQLFQVFEGER